MKSGLIETHQWDESSHGISFPEIFIRQGLYQLEPSSVLTSRCLNAEMWVHSDGGAEKLKQESQRFAVAEADNIPPPTRGTTAGRM